MAGGITTVMLRYTLIAVAASLAARLGGLKFRRVARLGRDASRTTT
jgi:hypothetical protein